MDTADGYIQSHPSIHPSHLTSPGSMWTWYACMQAGRQAAVLTTEKQAHPVPTYLYVKSPPNKITTHQPSTAPTTPRSVRSPPPDPFPGSHQPASQSASLPRQDRVRPSATTAVTKPRPDQTTQQRRSGLGWDLGGRAARAVWELCLRPGFVLRDECDR